MTLSEKVEKLKILKSQLKSLYLDKLSLEKDIVSQIEKSTDDELSILNHENTLEIALLSEKKVDYDKLKELYPNVYQWGLVPMFNYKKALLSFEDKKMFWKIMNDCKVDIETKKLKVKKNAKRTYKKYGN
mgnify:CR=1 FL=1